jgi:manganese peroxidase
MAFKKSLAALVFALPLVFGTNLYFRNNVNVLTTIVAASPARRSNNPACDFLEPIKQDLIENLFDDECGDAVSVFSP